MLKEKFLPWLIALILRLLGPTLRIRIDDRAGVLTRPAHEPVIWAFWHNRMLALAILRRRVFPHRGGSVLTSPSKDGAIIANVMKHLKVGSVRGSSSRRGSTALRELTRVIESGGDIAVTPDGPRGPKYKLGPGVILLAQKTGAPIVPLHVEYSHCLRAGRWDGFMIPWPFARLDVTFDKLEPIPPELTESAFEAERVRIEQVLMSGTKTL